MMREFDLEELASYDGNEGRPVYIAYDGKVFDVTGSKMWKGGLHMRRHHAGRDLTTDIQAAPHGVEMLERYPQIGLVRETSAEGQQIPEFLDKLLGRWPFLRRHPHPMTVHFPIAFMLATVFFTILYLLSGYRAFETTGFHCLAAGLFFTPIVILTGLSTWWLNYMARATNPILMKMAGSTALLLISLFAFSIRLQNPAILDTSSPSRVLYVLLIFLLAPIVMVVGWFGAQLTFPIEHSK